MQEQYKTRQIHTENVFTLTTDTAGKYLGNWILYKQNSGEKICMGNLNESLETTMDLERLSSSYTSPCHD